LLAAQESSANYFAVKPFVIYEGDNSVKLVQVPIVMMLTILAIPFPAVASLGGDTKSVQADQARLHGTLRSTTNGTYTVNEIRAPTGVVLREYVSLAGKVFGVAWQGPSRPDLRQVLGAYFEPFMEAVQAQKTPRVARGPLVIEQAGLVVEMGGHMRSFFGRAYIPEIMPPDVTAKEIQ
jgi:hypothetical protein